MSDFASYIIGYAQANEEDEIVGTAYAGIEQSCPNMEQFTYGECTEPSQSVKYFFPKREKQEQGNRIQEIYSCDQSIFNLYGVNQEIVQ